MIVGLPDGLTKDEKCFAGEVDNEEVVLLC